ncbi:MAG: hypothetical protein JWQ90_186 [Hydrocarboniphaga sp.]|uniref:hypothetical protein n=1 Tax=Hydrocarboniphaga sp. TaxID=2033016 RepID=UPI00260E22EE|nr:hypothetical protein [Hydrocarboniphaga sp.]MDB5967736.1 hypothetical protein [Hydrocarboniphaga sp.]
MAMNELEYADDLPRKSIPAGIPFWSESYAFWVYPDDHRFDLYIHYQRQVADPGIWKAMLVLLLDNGEALVTKSFGRQADDAGPGPAGLNVRCLEPGRRWALRFDAAAQRVLQADLWKSELRDGIVEPLFVEFELDAIAPVWSLDSQNLQKQEAMMSSHDEQAYRSKGVLRFGGRELTFTGAGYRDHSYGPRNYKRMGESQIVLGVFPSRRAFWFITGRTPEGVYAHCEGALAVDGKIYPLKVEDPPFHLDLLKGKESMDYVLNSELGKIRICVRYTGRGIPFSLTSPAEEVIGAVGGFDAVKLAYWEMQILSTWDGEVGVGSAQGTICR